MQPPDERAPAMKPPKLTPRELRAIARTTTQHYQQNAESFWRGTHDHDVAQNIDALLDAIIEMRQASPPFRILDFGCGPGRDLSAFIERGHQPTGLDGATAFVQRARAQCNCEVWLQDFLALQLPRAHFHGVFANASLFHIPRQEIVRVLGELRDTLLPHGVLFASNPRGDDDEGWHGARYGCYYTWRTWRTLATQAGFIELRHYYRPTGQPRHQQPWLASLWRK